MQAPQTACSLFPHSEKKNYRTKTSLTLKAYVKREIWSLNRKGYKISPLPLLYSLKSCKNVLGEINAFESFYTRELWFCHLAEFRTNPLSFDMFRLNLSQTLVLVYQEVSKAGHKMHILALMCTTKGYKMLTKGDNATQSMLIFVQLNVFYALSKQISEETMAFFPIYLLQ